MSRNALTSCIPRLLAGCVSLAVLSGCAVARSVQEMPPLMEGTAVMKHGANRFAVTRGEDVIGSPATVRLEKGDTLPDLARHFGLGINAVSAANPGVDVWVPQAGRRLFLPMSFILPDAPREGIVVNLAAMRLFRFGGNGDALSVTTFPVGVGTKEKPTPTGRMHVVRKATQPTWYVPASIAEAHRKKGAPLPAKVPPGPENPLGEFVLYLSKPSYLIHGTNKPASIGLDASNGCVRLYPEDVEMLYRETTVKTPVVIVNQPYLVGRRDGVVYLEAHEPLHDPDSRERERIFAKLKSVEREQGLSIDWEKVRMVQSEARGVPVPVSRDGEAKAMQAASPVEFEHPGKLYGTPEVPELRLDAWYVLAADVPDEIEALRMTAIINHQGPPIPARVFSKSGSHRVVTGPFDALHEAKAAARRLKIDLDLEGVLIEPVQEPRTKLTSIDVIAK